MKRPRNLRPPTPLRVYWWWSDFLRVWRAISVAANQDLLAEDEP